MKYTKILILSAFLSLFSLNAPTVASTGDIDGWKIHYVDMNCITDGVALDPQNNYIWNVKFLYPVQNQLNLVVGLYNEKAAEILKALSFDKVKAWLLIEESEFQAQELMLDKNGWLVLRLDNSNTLQKNISENTQISLILQPNPQSEKFRLSELHVSKAKSAFDWLQKCAVFGIRSMPDN